MSKIKDNWQNIKLKDIAEVNKASIAKGKFQYDEIEYIDISSVGTGELKNTTTLPLQKAPSRAKRLVQPGSIILSTVRPNRRSFYYIKKPKENCVVSTGFGVIDAIGGLSDSRFLYYVITDQAFTNYLVNHAKGAAYPAVDSDTIENADLVIPPLPTQQRIASILSAFDDLIENNTRRIKILEEMAQAIYEEWFVRFRFPGHENVRLVDSGTEFGEIPEGWEVEKCADVIDVMSGGTPKTKIPEYWDEKIPFFTPKDASHSFYCLETEKSISELGLSKCNSKLYPKNTVFITARGTVGKCNLAPFDMAMNQSCYALSGTSKGISNLYVYLAILKLVEGLKKQAIGGVFDTITVATFERLDFLLPQQEIIDLFERKFSPLFEQLRGLTQKNKKLREIRNLLLPRLVSGELEVIPA